jgi:hypothetical protein
VFIDGKHWVLTAPLLWDDPEKAWTITVPAGFQTDFASVPRGFWNLFPPTGRYAPAAVLHDFLYAVGRVGSVPVSRAYADGVLRRASGDLGVSGRVRWFMWLGVRSFGGGLWRKYREGDHV